MTSLKPPDSDSIDDYFDELAHALGEAVWAFARIEARTYEYLVKMKAGRNEVLSELQFSQRVSILRKYVRAEASETRARDKALSLLKRAISLAEQRNLFVHNPWSIWIDLDSEQFVSEIRHALEAKHTPINLETIKAFTAEARQLEGDLIDAMHSVLERKFPA